MRPTLRILACALAPLLVSAAACSSDSDDSTANPSGKEAERGLEITAYFTPDPPVVGENTLHIRVEDLNGLPQTGAVVIVDPQMPAMGHGSSAEPVVTEDDEPGDYTASPVTFTMPGEWEVTIDVTIDVTVSEETGQLVKTLSL